MSTLRNTCTENMSSYFIESTLWTPHPLWYGATTFWILPQIQLLEARDHWKSFVKKVFCCAGIVGFYSHAPAISSQQGNEFGEASWKGWEEWWGWRGRHKWLVHAEGFPQHQEREASEDECWKKRQKEGKMQSIKHREEKFWEGISGRCDLTAKAAPCPCPDGLSSTLGAFLPCPQPRIWFPLPEAVGPLLSHAVLSVCPLSQGKSKAMDFWETLK